jgi:hypothetical protein
MYSIMSCWVRDPPPPCLLLYAKGVKFIRKIQVGYNLSDPDTISTCLILQDLSIKYLLNCLGYEAYNVWLIASVSPVHPYSRVSPLF